MVRKKISIAIDRARPAPIDAAMKMPMDMTIRVLDLKMSASLPKSGSDTARAWQQIAQLGQGEYLQVEQGGGAVAIATPFDEKLATLSAQLDDTRLYYGSEADKQRQQRRLEATEKLHAAASVSSRARRATFNASASGAVNLLGDEISIDRGGVTVFAEEPGTTLSVSFQYFMF